ncbi:MAG: dihydroorotate dehydrogenase [Paludibacteraceae bacterium]|nr:dihydroorotate dehydrogenase [Paludibacteraceae bacterium]
MKVKLGHIALQNPVIPASGTCGFGQEMSEWFDLNILGAIATKGTTLEARYGNALPRIAECPAGLINAIGLQNPGVDEVIAHEMPALRKLYRGPIIANISGFSIDEYAYVCERIDKESDAAILEVNISCPNVHNGGMAFGTSPEAAAEVTKAVKAVTNKPVFMKLSPNVTDIVSIARACVEAGADGLCLINTVLGMRIDIRRRKPVIANRYGGYSGPGVFPIALRMVNQVSKACPGIPIIGCGGVSNAEEVIEMMMAGASAVEIGAANLQNPQVCREIIEALPAVMREMRIDHLQDIIGIV